MSKLIPALEILIASGIRIDSSGQKGEPSTVIKVGHQKGVVHIGPRSPQKILFATYNRNEEREFHVNGFIVDPPSPSVFDISGTKGDNYQYCIHHHSSSLPNFGHWTEVPLDDYHRRLNELVNDTPAR